MDTAVMVCLKDLPLRLQTSQLSVRKEIFQDLTNLFKEHELPENVVKGVCKVLSLTLTRYQDAASRRLVVDFIRLALSKSPEIVAKTIHASLLEAVGGWREAVPTRPLAKLALGGMAWSCLALTGYPALLDSEGKKVLELHCILVPVVRCGGASREIGKLDKLLRATWTLDSVKERYLAAVESSEGSLPLLVVGSHLLEVVAPVTDEKKVAAIKQFLIDMLIKVCVSGKKKPREELLQVMNPLLSTITSEDFRNQLLPAMSKALLRSPEIALLTVSHILGGLSQLDLSAQAAELGKTFATNLKSKDDATREDATKAILALGQQCGEEEAATSLLRQVFAVLNGSEGKITVPAHKASLLQAAGHLSTAAGRKLTGAAVLALANLATELFVKFLESETNEATLILALEMLAKWAAMFVSELPASLVAWWPKGMADKAATSPVRSAYLLALMAGVSAISGQVSALPLVPHLLKLVETAAASKQPAGAAVQAIAEGVHAAACLLRIARDESLDLANKLGDFFTIICDTDKQPFYTEKFLTTAGSAALQSLSVMAATLLISHADRMNDDQLRGLLHVLNICLVSHDTLVRRQAISWVKKLGSTLGGGNLVVQLLEDLGRLVSRQTVTADTANRGEVGGGGDIPASGGDIPACGLIGALTGIVGGLKGLLTSEDRERLCLAALVAAHPPALADLRPGLWPQLVKMAGLDLAELLDSHKERIIGLLQEQVVGHNPTLAQEIVKTLIRHRPQVILPHVLASLISVLSDRALLAVSVAEYQTYLTPPGELYDKSVIESIKPDSTGGGNIRRENKAYSYKEQMEEIALRKELEEKKRREGKLKAPELTPKQKEVMKAQLEKEAAVRTRVGGMLAACQPALCLFEACLASGSPEALASDVTDLLPVIYRALQSPLVARSLSNAYSQLRRAVFTADDETLAQHVSGVTMQILRPACENLFTWDDSQLKQGVLRVLDMLHASSVPSKDENQEDNSCPLSAPAFAYCFPLIREAMKANVNSSSVVTKGLEIISEHTSLRGGDNDEDKFSDMFHPHYLPRADILRLLVDLIGRTEGSLQQATVKCLIDAAEAASGATGCATAGPAEVECLLGALQSDCDAVRDAALRGLIAMVKALPKDDESDLHMSLVRRCWVARADPLPENRLLADQLWEEANLTAVPSRLTLLVLDDVAHPVGKVRSAASEALAKLLEEDSALAGEVLSQLLATYQEKLIPTPPVVDSLGRIVEPAIDHWEPRSGIALALARIAPFYTESMVIQTASFFIPQGLGDRSEAVRKDMLNAAVATIDLHGKATVGRLLPVFEDFLDSAPTDKSYDTVRQSVVILMGGLARHLDKDDPKVRPIIGKLISALATPSQQVQEAVANCLPPLVPSVKDEAPKLVSELLNTLLTTENFGERKGAAYGLAGLVKGLGILALKQLDIMNRLTEALQDKKNARHREGALFALSQLCSMLGRLFEPYIVHVLPHLLLCFGDANQYVREATDDCAKAVMSKLSAHGVKLVLPSLLAALEEDQWRTKTGSVELLGAMAFCAPKQLSSCLPSIVPKLIEVLGDSHQKVQNAGAQALKQIGSVIRNPEIQAIVPILLSALQDPAKKTGVCLQTLLQTQFVHFIDAPSLALIMPAVQRAFQDRSTETRKMAAQIIGNMYSLTDQKDLAPYLPGIIPGLKASLLDPVPEVRAVSARALGAMVRGMGEASFEELLPWLMSTLTSESSSVDRSGAAQGLAEVVGGLGVDKMHKLMPEIVSTAERMDIAPHVKDGYIMMFIYMPGVFPDEFLQYIGQVVQPILRALADENEYVRETALKAGQRIVNMYAESAIMLLLPQLEQGLFDDNWRIRYSSVQLLGDLLYKISGVSGKMTTETASEDDNFGTEQGQKIITKMLGVERRNRVLAGLYMGRSDVALMVRQAALHVWKVIVTNTPRTLREILPTLFNLLLGCLASNSYDKRQVAARTLGDLVRKLGERVLPEIIPILEQGLASDQPDKRQGVCVGLSEIIVSTSREMVLSFVNSLVPTVQRALCDSDPAVRMAAAKTFDSLHTTVGARALDDILPHMLEQLSNPEQHENTLDGLRQVMAIKSRVVLPYLVPQLTASPVNTKALSILASVAGEALNRHLARILPALLTSLADSHGRDNETQELQYCQAVVLSVTEETGVSYVIDILLESCRSKESVTRRGAVTLLHAFCEQTKVDYYEYVPQLIRSLILLMADTDEGVLQEAWNALNAVTKTLDANAQLAHVGDVRQAVRFAFSEVKDGNLLPGFCLSKGISPLLPIFRESILNGAPELKEQAAQGLGEVIKVTSAEALKPSVVHITGPLIRILGDRFSHNVKTAVLETLTILLGKASAMLKPFLPQLQTTFLKALNDTNRTVRLKAGAALAHLITIHTRPDPLYNELHTGIKNADEASVRDTYLQALRGCVTSSGDKLSAVIRKPVTQTLLGLLNHLEDSSRLAAAGCLAALTRWLPDEERAAIITDTILDDNKSLDWTVRHGRSAAMFVLLHESPEVIYTDAYAPKVIKTILSHISADRVPVAANGVRSAGFLMAHFLATKVSVPSELVIPFTRAMNHASNDVKILVAVMASYIAKRESSLLPSDLLKAFLPMLVNGTKEKNSLVKSSSESALVDIMQMRRGPSGQQQALSLLDPGMRESLTEVISKSLTKLATQSEGGETVIDETLLS